MSANPIYVIGIDLGGTRIKVGLVDTEGKILLLRNFSTHLGLGKEKALKRIVKKIRQFIDISIENQLKPKMIGLGVAGLVDRKKGFLLRSPNFPDWKDVPLARIITEEISLPVYMDNDANVITLGEKWAGAGKKWDNFVCLTLGTGVGSGLILNGRPWYGSQGNGPEIGHITIEPRGERCGCGNRGCLETLASSTYLVKKAQKGVDKKVHTLLSEMVKQTAEPLSAKLLYETAKQGDPFCITLFAELGRYLGIALANLIHILGLEGVVLGGGLSKAFTIFLPYLEKEFKKRMTMIPGELPPIRVSSLGDKSGILGAAKMAMERSKEKPKAYSL